jgi:hypothetical protein
MKGKVIKMSHLKTIAKGITVGITLGAVCYVISQSTPHQKREISRNARRTIHSFGNVISNFTSMIR